MKRFRLASSDGMEEGATTAIFMFRISRLKRGP
jgi:hypothetical protein